METENLNTTNDNLSAVEQQVQNDVETASRSLKAMSHPLRLMILQNLSMLACMSHCSWQQVFNTAMRVMRALQVILPLMK